MLGFWIAFSIVLLLMLAVLELNRNMLIAFALLALVAVGFALLFCRVLRRKWYFGALGWLGFLASFVLILLCTWPPVKPVPAYEPGTEPIRTKVVSLQDGDVRGVVIENGAVELYAGIPYAAPPVGELRWKAPQNPQPWDGVLEADHFAPMAAQPTNLPIYNSLSQIIGYHDYRISLYDNYVEPVSEDALYVNVWKPAGAQEGLPVIVYIHGGSLQTGQPWYSDYAGKGIAAAENVVVVNLGYRLGAFGFLAAEELAAESGTTGNYGLLDQIKALEWVRDNIAAFGGDPNQVTLAGESAGSACVSALCTSPLANGLFRYAILESSTLASVDPPHSYRTYDEAIESGKEMMERLGVTTLAELRALDESVLYQEAYTQHHITIDGTVLIESPYESYRKGIHNEEAILHGYNSEESGPFILFSAANMDNYEQRIRDYFEDYADEVLAVFTPTTDEEAAAYWADIYGAVFFNYPHYCLNRLAAECGIPAYEYRFQKANGRLGAWHSGELIYLYGNIPTESNLFDQTDRALSETIMAYVKNFAVSGDPNGDGLPAWEIVPNGTRLMQFDTQSGMAEEKLLSLYAILDRMQGWGEEQ